MPVSSNRWKGKVAVVTGTSSGIGAAIAEKLVEENLQVVGLDKRYQGIKVSQKFPGKPGTFRTIQADVTKEEDILKAFNWVTDNLGPVHILVNNAGVFQRTTLLDGDTEKWRLVLDTNVLSLCIATREAIKIMRANNIDGHIIHINSKAGHIVPNFPGLNMYPASKHAVTALTETLRQELNQIGSKIKITSVSPGRVATQIGTDDNDSASQKEIIAEEVRTPELMLKPEDVADCVSYILSTPPHVQVHEATIAPLGE